jgi:glycosyltransferase involved in cell wall biosynthesis
MASKTVTTLHGRLDVKDLSKVFALWRQFPLVSISHSQRGPIPTANWIATVAHGVPPTTYAVAPQPTADYLAFIGRISPEKRPEIAIELAKASGIPLKIAAKVDTVDRGYFEAEIEPLLDDPLIEFVGEIGDADKADFLGNARALLFPIDWPEPFGLVMIEAMACGTPVIAWDRGSVREVIDEGVTGFIVNDAAAALAAIDAASELDRHRIRATFELRFSANTMARNYLGVYTRLLQSRGQHLPVLRTETEEILNDECER